METAEHSTAPNDRSSPEVGKNGGRYSIRELPWPVLVPLAGMLLAILIVVLVRVKRLDVPFERDEGEYAYIGQLMLQGVAPYGAAANMKLPGTYATYAFVMALFGQTVRGVHLGFLFINLGCILLLYLIGKRLFGPIAGVAAAASYAMLSVSLSVDGFWAHATHCVVLCALTGTLLLFRWAERPRVTTLMGSGVCFGLAFLMKQPGVLFGLFGAFYIVHTHRPLRSNWPRLCRDLCLFGVAAALPLGITCVLLWHAGVFARFWFWVVTYATQYVSIRSLADGVDDLKHNALPVAKFSFILCILAMLGLVVLWRRKDLRTAALVTTAFLIFSCLAVCPGLYFRPHYFVLALPAAALLIGAFSRSGTATMAGIIPLWLIAGGLADSMWTQRGYLFQMSPNEVLRNTYGLAPFPEAVPVAAYIRAHSEIGESIAVLGSEPEIYFYSGRRSVTPYLYVEPLTEPQPLVAQMQQEYIDDIEAWKPKYVVYANWPFTWGNLAHSEQGLLGWAKRYYEQNYDTVGVADIDLDETVYKWDDEAAHYRIRSADYVLVLRRK